MKKETKKRVFACLLSASLIASSFHLLPIMSQADETSTPYPEGITVDENGTAQISVSGAGITGDTLKSAKDIKKFEIEDGNTTYSTTENREALMNADGSELIRFACGFHTPDFYFLPDSLKNITNYSCAEILDTQKFVIPPTVENIGDFGFYQGSNLTKILFNEKTENSKLTTIGAYAFAYNPNLEISLPHSVTSLGEYCFAYCSNMQDQSLLTDEYNKETVTAGILDRTSITEIPAYCFYQCINLHEVNLPATVTSIGDYAFSGCTNMNTINFNGTSLKSLGTGAFEGNSNLHTISIPEGVTTISAGTFEGCQNLNSVHLPDTVTTIEDNAFSNCNNIHEMNIPESVTEISPTAFANVTNLEGIDTSKSTYASELLGKTAVAAPTPTPSNTAALTPQATDRDSTVSTSPSPSPAEKKVTYLKKGKTFTAGKYKYKVISSSSKSASVMLMGYKNKEAKKAQKPRTLTVTQTVKYKKLTYKITSIKAKAFKNCKKIKTVKLYNQTTIGSQAFYGCKSLKKVHIYGKKLKKIGKKAFQKTNKKAVIYIHDKPLLYKKVKGKGIKKILIKK